MSIIFDINGKYYRDEPGGECLLFPSRENHDWSTFVTPPCNPKKGDFVYRMLMNGEEWLSIHNCNGVYNDVFSFADFILENDSVEKIEDSFISDNPLCFITDIKVERFATDDEKNMILEKLSELDYIWDSNNLELVKRGSFQKGDFVYRKMKSGNEWLSIHNRIDPNNRIGEVISFVNLAIERDNINMFFFVCRDKDENPLCWNDDIVYQRLATEQEKADILKAIGNNGYIWDADRFELRKKSESEPVTTADKPNCPNTWDKVLVRDRTDQPWEIEWFGRTYTIDTQRFYICTGGRTYKYCLPYEGNERMYGKIVNP